jgi:nitrile hydratase alpha subunit
MPAREEAEKQLIAKAWKDPKFRQSLIQNPREVISKEFGIEIPPDISVKVLEETSDNLYLVLPASPAAGGGELSDMELEAIAGGATKTPAPTTQPTPTPTPCPCPITKQQTLY